MRYFLGAIVLALVLYYALPFFTGPSQVISDVAAFPENNNVVVQVNFSVPVRYENHFPQRNGEFLQIKMRLVTLGKMDWKEAVPPTAIRPEIARQISLAGLSYEGNVEGGPFLTFLFTRPVEFEVRQDSALRSLVVVFPQAAAQKGAAL